MGITQVSLLMLQKAEGRLFSMVNLLSSGTPVQNMLYRVAC